MFLMLLYDPFADKGIFSSLQPLEMILSRAIDSRSCETLWTVIARRVDSALTPFPT